MMEMPRPQEEHRRLRALAGNWIGEETIHPSAWDPKGGAATGRFEAKVDMDDFFVLADYIEERDGKVSYRGHGVFGYEPKEKIYTMHWFDSMGSGTPTPARGRWEGNRLSFEQKTPMGHSRYSYNFDGDKRFTFTIDSSQDGRSWATIMEGRYTRK
jgi:uncharacterized protein DUF1579